jgi:DNA polymerase sigma
MFVIKFDTVQGVSVDLSFWSKTQHMGSIHSHFIRGLVLQFPGVLAPLVLCLKHVLRRKGLNSAFTGGVSSIALVMMVWVYIRMQPKSTSLGSLLLGFLDRFGEDGFFSSYGVCARRGIFRLEERDITHVGGNAHVEDPMREGNNLSFGMYRASLVSKTFQKLAHDLREGRLEVLWKEL